MTDFGWNYPPGMPAPRRVTLEFKCANEECPECGTYWEAEGVDELGGVWLTPEEGDRCPECGEEGKQL